MKSEKNISISVVTATWNCVDTLQDSLDSLARQSYKNCEHIVVDGASNDGTLELINKNLNRISHFKSEKDKGIYDALNKGIKLATGDVVGFLHADDLYASDKVLEDIAKIFEDPTVGAVYGDLDYVSQEDVTKVIRHWRSKSFKKRDLEWGWMPAHPTLYVRREWYSRIGGFDINYQISADYLSVLKLFVNPELKAVYLPSVLVKMRMGGASNKSLNALIKKSREDWMALRACGYGRFRSMKAIAWKNLSKINQFL